MFHLQVTEEHFYELFARMALPFVVLEHLCFNMVCGAEDLATPGL